MELAFEAAPWHEEMADRPEDQEQPMIGISETQAVKRAVKNLKGQRLRTHGMSPKGKSKKLSRFAAGRSLDLGYGAAMAVVGAKALTYTGVPRLMRKRLAKRIGKKLGQPFRRKPRKHRRAAGKNNVRPSRGTRR